jgi:hypothetical protein
MPPSGTRSECVPGLQCLLFHHAGPEEYWNLAFWYIQLPADHANMAGMFHQNQPIYICYALITAYKKTVSAFCKLTSQLPTFTKLCSCVFSGRIGYEFGNFKLVIGVPQWCIPGNSIMANWQTWLLLNFLIAVTSILKAEPFLTWLQSRILGFGTLRRMRIFYAVIAECYYTPNSVERYYAAL